MNEKQKKTEKKITEPNKGITLIALVITIIVLLILAGVTIATLTSDSGLLTKASDAKKKNEETTALEKIKLEVAGSYGVDGKIDIENQLNQNLHRIDGLTYKNKAIKIDGDDKNMIEKLPATVKLDIYEFEIYEDGEVIGGVAIDYTKLRALYGTVVNGYTAGNMLDASKKVESWKLFYADEKNKEVFLISSNTLPSPQPDSSGIPSLSKYVGSNSVKNIEYGNKYNGLWIEKCTTNNSTTRAKETAYMCDPENWKQYLTGKAKYATGGATLEMFVASYYNQQIEDFKDESYSGNIRNCVDFDGYSVGAAVGISNIQIDNFYNNGDESYWLASPGYVWGHNNDMVFISKQGNIGACDGYPESGYYGGAKGLRPVVCLSASAIKINGNELSI